MPNLTGIYSNLPYIHTGRLFRITGTNANTFSSNTLQLKPRNN